ncbi:AAA family ATPase [Thermoactinomyces daqus]|uniref:DNA 5'-3' helicase n=1 Tax=Thermoactinomyces daqus TaxID=1329516 RepID=A0A7W1XDD1_9BACL|nr:DnaB-like helicase C-terminal domain-containing protein [Thermoactinomyces daqus]MBA4544611.1 AAA family ATPase [Thermoactinomyces daqus]
MIAISVELAEHTRNLEEQIIGGLATDPGAYEKVEDILDPRFFYHPGHRQLAERIITKIKTDINSVNPTQLAYDFAECGVPISIISQVLTTAYMRSHCEELKNLYLFREMKSIAGEIVQKEAIRNSEELAQTVADFRDKIAEIEDSAITQTPKSMTEAVLDLIDFLDDDKPDRAVKTGIHDLDILTGGFKPSELIVIGARPSMGKTALSLSMLDAMGAAGKRILYLSFEMSTLDILKRMAAMKATIDLHRLNLKNKDGKRVLTAEEYQKLSEQMAIIANYPVFFHDRAGKTSEIRLLAKRQMRKEGLDCIILDHLGKVRPDNPRVSKYEQISQIICDLKDIAKEMDVPIVVLSQLSRGVEQRNNKRPVLSDLRESGEIEQEADMVMFLYRDDYYDPTSQLAGCLEIDLQKHRNGPTGKVLTGFIKHCARVVNLDQEYKKKYRDIISAQV